MIANKLTWNSFLVSALHKNLLDALEFGDGRAARGYDQEVVSNVRRATYDAVLGDAALFGPVFWAVDRSEDYNPALQDFLREAGLWSW